ncbi:MAG: hypothetical protein ACJAT2_002350 [Bacteriovoracaceae bacterium]|jgi:hypothetical protein
MSVKKIVEINYEEISLDMSELIEKVMLITIVGDRINKKETLYRKIMHEIELNEKSNGTTC